MALRSVPLLYWQVRSASDSNFKIFPHNSPSVNPARHKLGPDGLLFIHSNWSFILKARSGWTSICPSQSLPAVLMIRFHVTPRVPCFDMMSLECCAPYKMTSQLYLNRRTSIEVMMASFNTAPSPHASHLWPINTPSFCFRASACLSPVRIFELLASSAFRPPHNFLFPVLSPVSLPFQAFLFLLVLCLLFFFRVLGCLDNG